MKKVNIKQIARAIRLIILVISLSFLSFTSMDKWPGNGIQKKLGEEATDSWNEEEVSVEEVKASPFGSSEKHKQLYVIRKNNKKLGFGYIGRVQTCRPGGCSRPTGNSIQNGSFEYFDYLMILSKDFEVKKVEIINYQATRGYEISSRNWLKQFVGFTGKKDLKYRKDIQAISGATVSATSIIEDIEQTLKRLNRGKAQE